MKPIDLRKFRRISIRERGSKVKVENFGEPPVHSPSLNEFFDRLPSILRAKDLLRLSSYIVEARKRRKEVLFMMGAHPVKVGIVPYLIDLLRNGFVTAFAANTAFLVHDIEIAFFGETSEEVGKMLERGLFGVAKETSDLIKEALSQEEGGLGERIGRFISEKKPKYHEKSLLYHAYESEVPFTLHMCIGCDIYHQDPEIDIIKLSRASYEDFVKLASVLADIEEGVVLNIGSAVVMPEVFLKALNLARNLGYSARNFVAANFDMYEHYRPRENILRRTGTKECFCFLGHHEIMIPLLWGAIRTKAEKRT